MPAEARAQLEEEGARHDALLLSRSPISPTPAPFGIVTATCALAVALERLEERHEKPEPHQQPPTRSGRRADGGSTRPAVRPRDRRCAGRRGGRGPPPRTPRASPSRPTCGAPPSSGGASLGRGARALERRAAARAGAQRRCRGRIARRGTPAGGLTCRGGLLGSRRGEVGLEQVGRGARVLGGAADRPRACRVVRRSSWSVDRDARPGASRSGERARLGGLGPSSPESVSGRPTTTRATSRSADERARSRPSPRRVAGALDGGERRGDACRSGPRRRSRSARAVVEREHAAHASP